MLKPQYRSALVRYATAALPMHENYCVAPQLPLRKTRYTYHLGRAYEGAGNYPAAVEAYGNATQLRTDF